MTHKAYIGNCLKNITERAVGDFLLLDLFF